MVDTLAPSVTLSAQGSIARREHDGCRGFTIRTPCEPGQVEHSVLALLMDDRFSNGLPPSLSPLLAAALDTDRPLDNEIEQLGNLIDQRGMVS